MVFAKCGRFVEIEIDNLKHWVLSKRKAAAAVIIDNLGWVFHVKAFSLNLWNNLNKWRN